MTKILIGVAAAVVVAGGAWYFMGTKAPAGPSPMVQDGSLQVFAARGGTSKCEVHTNTDGVTSSGTIYVDKGLVRGDFSSTMPETGEVESHLIVRDGYTYMWSSAMPQGIKTKVEASGSASGGAEQNPYNANYSYECSNWNADQAMFTVPSDVTFMEFNN